MTTIKPFPTGCIVITPTGRRAKVLRYVGRDDPRCELSYQDSDTNKAGWSQPDLVVLRPGLLRLAETIQ